VREVYKKVIRTSSNPLYFGLFFAFVVAFHELCQEGNLPPYAIGKEVGIWNGKRY